MRALRTFTNDTEAYVADAGREHTLHRTDLAALAVVMDRSDQGLLVTPGTLSVALRLSAPATSAMLDRLERYGHIVRQMHFEAPYVYRAAHPTDRRSVVVEMTDHARTVGQAMFSRLAGHLSPVLAGYTDQQLALVAEFLERACQATKDATQERT